MKLRDLALVILAVTGASCAEGLQGDPAPETNVATGVGAAGGGPAGEGAGAGGATAFPGVCGAPTCSLDAAQLIDCHGVVTDCPTGTACVGGQCMTSCDLAQASQSSVGCEYYALAMDGVEGASFGCFAAFVANTSDQPAHLGVHYLGAPLDLAAIARIPIGAGQSLTYGAYDPAAGLGAGEVAVLFLAGGAGTACPVTPAVQWAQVIGTSRGYGFQIDADVPVVAYQMMPFGGGSAAVTGASLLLPTSAWDTNYIAVDAYQASLVGNFPPTMAIVAKENGTTVTLLPKVPVQAGIGVQGSSANVPVTYALSAGEVIQFAQMEELTGSPIQANKPIGLWAGHRCMTVPADLLFCDHAEQQIPPIRALGTEYVGVSYRQRSTVPENPLYRIVGVADGTSFTYDPPVNGAPSSVDLGDVIEFHASEPFVVRSQDSDHPFLFVTYMSGSQNVDINYGDPDFVRLTPADQYLDRYVFFTDPTYPETNLVVVRRKGPDGFSDVSLGCAGVLGGWTAIDASGQYEFTRTDLVRHDFEPQGSCDNGRNEMTSDQPFGLWVWGWGTPETSIFTSNVSYGYPAGEGVALINDVVVPPVPR